jgi:hypothetical protein
LALCQSSGSLRRIVGDGHTVMVFTRTVVRKGGSTVTPNVRGNRPAEAGGLRLARDSGEVAARQPYAACRSGSG